MENLIKTSLVNMGNEIPEDISSIINNDSEPVEPLLIFNMLCELKKGSR